MQLIKSMSLSDTFHSVSVFTSMYSVMNQCLNTTIQQHQGRHSFRAALAVTQRVLYNWAIYSGTSEQGTQRGKKCCPFVPNSEVK